LAGCGLLGDDYPDRHCEADRDCFQAQGEVCDLAQNLCVQGTAADAAEPPIDSPVTIDAPVIDAAEPDAAEPDAAEPDAAEPDAAIDAALAAEATP
jgi:hypothetical protein